MISKILLIIKIEEKLGKYRICAYFNNALDINLGDLGRPLFPV
jgi:hypothetical protein